MISSLDGKVAEATPPILVIECNGVGYEVWMPASCFEQLPGTGERVRVLTTLVVRDDSHTLYGFLHAGERTLFGHLLRISGVGAKTALGLLSYMDAGTLAQAVETGDVKGLTRAPGVGRKTAERILIELRDSNALVVAPAETPVRSQAVEALVALGFPAPKARSAVTAVQGEGMDVSALVKAALAKLSPPGN